MAEKIVVQAWTQKARNYEQTAKDGFWGIGDLLRGSNVLFDACKAIGAGYVLDITGHPVSNIFTPANSVGADPGDVEFWTFGPPEEVSERLTNALAASDRLVLNTNGGRNWPAESSADWSKLVRQVMTPNPIFEQHLAQVMPSEPYNIFHFRLGDAGLVRGEKSQLRRAIQALDRHGEHDDIVITDSLEFQEYIRNHRKCFRVSDAIPVHTGLSSDTTTIAQTMGDFFLIGHAKKAKSYSVYGHTSGFVVAASRLFDVPLISLSVRSKSRTKNLFKKLKALWR